MEKHKNNVLNLPVTTDGKHYELQNLRSDQANIAAMVLQTIQKWIDTKNYKQCLMTVMGVAGSGKSILIKTIVTAVRKMFGRNDVVYVGAPTGSAAFSAGGETIHRLFGVWVHQPSLLLRTYLF